MTCILIDNAHKYYYYTDMQRYMGVGIVILSTALYALISPLLKKANHNIPPFTVMTISMFVLFLLSLIFSIFFEQSFQVKTLLKPNVLFLVMAGIINFVGFYLAIQGYRYMPLWEQSLISLLSPVFIGFFASLILGEPLSPKLLLGLLFMGIGIFVVIR